MGEVVGGIFGAIGANKQADAVEDAADKSAEVQRYMFDRSVELSEPWRAGGQNALAALQYELGLAERPTASGTRWRVGGEEFDTREEAEAHQQSLGGGGAQGGTTATSGGEVPGNRLVPIIGAEKEGNPLGLVTLGGSGFGSRPVGAANLGNALRDFAGGGGAGGGVPGIEEIEGGGFDYAGFQKTPGYEFQLDEGQRAINRSLAARGRALSGPAVKEGMRFSQGLADQTYSNHLARLAQLSGLGGNVSTTLGGYAIDTGQGIAKTHMSAGAQIGNARASGYSALGQGIGTGLNSLAGFAGYGGKTGFGAGNPAFGSFGFF